MNWLDIVLIAVFALATFVGLRRGLIRMVFPLVGLVIGIILAGRFHDVVGGWLPIDDSQYASWAGYAIIVIIALIVSAVLAHILRRFISLVLLGWVDRLGGALFGLALGVLFCSAVLAACVKFGLGLCIIQDSGIATLLLDWFPLVLILLPGEFGDTVRDFFQYGDISCNG